VLCLDSYDTGWSGEVDEPRAELASISDAHRMAGKLDQSANTRAGSAAKIRGCAERRSDALSHPPGEI
jgi:hypothetical protein